MDDVHPADQDARRVLRGIASGQVLQRVDGNGSATIEFAGGSPSSMVVRREGQLVAGAWLRSLDLDRVEVGGIPLGGPYSVAFHWPDEHLVVEPIFVGDLWLLAGQSNMQGVGDLADAPSSHPLVRAFTLARRWDVAQEPIHYLPESPDPVHHEGRPQGPDEAQHRKSKLAKGVGPGLWFGLRRVADTQVPQGLIAAAHGGTSMSQWDPALGELGAESLYGSMLLSCREVGQPLAGVLWYQGCNDANPQDSPAYTERMKALVAAARTDLRQPDLPWLVVQIGRLVERNDNQTSWMEIQDQQRCLPRQIPGLDVVSVIDLELDDLIHLSARAHRILGDRLALVASRLVDGLDVAPTPQPRSARWDTSDPGGGAVVVEFDHVGSLTSGTDVPRGFYLTSDDGSLLPALCRVRVEGNRAWLRLTGDELPCSAVGYAYGCDPSANVVDGRGFSLPAFRNLPIENFPAVSRWFRRWQLRSLEAASNLETLSGVPAAALPGWEDHTVQGWWYLILESWWARGPLVAGRSSFTCAEPMRIEIRLGNDVPFRFFLDDEELFSEVDPSGLTSSDIDFERHRHQVSVDAGPHQVSFLARARSGGLGLDLRLARVDRPRPLPEPQI